MNNKPKMKLTYLEPTHSRAIWMDFECIVDIYNQVKSNCDGLLDWQI